MRVFNTIPLLALLVQSACLMQRPPEMASRHCASTYALTEADSHVENALTLGRRANANQVIELRLHFRQKDPAGLERFLAELADPAHPHYRQFLTNDQFRQRFGHHDADEAIARVYLQSEGFDLGLTKGHVLHARAQIKDAERVFGTEIYRAVAPNEMPQFAVAKKPEWAASLGIDNVVGLSGHAPRHTHIRSKTPHAFMPTGQEALRPAAIRGAYNIPGKSTGKGQTVALLELDGYVASDLKHFAEILRIPQVPVTNVLVGGFDGNVQDQDARVEVTMDIELVMAMAPGLQEIRVIEAGNGAHGLTDVLNELANPTTEDKLLIRWAGLSWGAPERSLWAADAVAEERILKQLAAQGQTLFVASGDDGAKDDGSHIGTDDPASQPYAVAVGGTTLTVQDNQWVSETTWSGGGGGVSCFWKAPSWQHPMLPAAEGVSKMRNVPDVALNADPSTGYLVYVNGWQTVGGTSCAAPLWAAFGALVDERRLSVGKTPIGFITPALYAVGSGKAGKSAFHDVADNSTNGYYPAVEGRDDATGWGSINGVPLLDALSQ